MEKGEATILAQLLTSMNEAATKLEEAYKKENMAELASAKREILKFQKEIDKHL